MVLPFHGDLAEESLAGMLFTIHRHKVPGTMEVISGKMRRQIFIERGQIIFAASNVAEDRLGEFLMRQNVISKEHFDFSCHEMKVRHVRQGKIFLEMGLFNAEMLGYYIKCQIKDIIQKCFATLEGRLTFTPGHEKSDEVIKLAFDTPLAILEAQLGLEHADQAERVFKAGRMVLRKRSEIHQLFEEANLPLEIFNIYNEVGKKRNVDDIVALFPRYPRTYILNVLLALYSLELVEDSHRPIQIRFSNKQAARAGAIMAAKS